MWLTLVLLAFVWPFGLCNDPDLPFNLANTASNREMCWERCFQVEDDDSERFRYVLMYCSTKVDTFFCKSREI